MSTFELTLFLKPTKSLALHGLTLLVALLALAHAPGVQAAPPSQADDTAQGVISGQILDVTADQPVSDIEVTLLRFQTDAEGQIDSELTPLTTEVDSLGFFRFEDLPTDDTIVYQAHVNFQSVDYYSDVEPLSPESTEITLPLAVYESTDKPDSIAVQRLHFIIMIEEPGTLSVIELYQFSNDSNRSYVGTAGSDGRPETVRVALPAGAQDLVLQGGILGQDYWLSGEELIGSPPVLPGQATLDVAFAYYLPYDDSSSANLDRPVYYNTLELNGLLVDAGAELESDTLALVENVSARGQDFLRYAGQDLAANQALNIRVDNLDKIQLGMPANHPSGTAAQRPATGLSQKTLLWLIVGLGVLVIAFAIAYPALRPHLKMVPTSVQSDPEQERQRLLLTLARLDQAHENGEIDESLYVNVRAQYKARLVNLWER